MKDLLKDAIKKKHIIRIRTKEGEKIHYPDLEKSLPAYPEEFVRAWCYSKIVDEYGYPPELLVFEHQIKMGREYKRADIVILDALKKPFIIVECKREDISDNVFEEAREQGFSYADRERVRYLWTSSGTKNMFERISYKGSQTFRQRIHALPPFGKRKTFKYRFWQVLSAIATGFFHTKNLIIDAWKVKAVRMVLGLALLVILGITWYVPELLKLIRRHADAIMDGLFIIFSLALILLIISLFRRKKKKRKRRGTKRKGKQKRRKKRK